MKSYCFHFLPFSLFADDRTEFKPLILWLNVKSSTTVLPLLANLWTWNIIFCHFLFTSIRVGFKPLILWLNVTSSTTVLPLLANFWTWNLIFCDYKSNVLSFLHLQWPTSELEILFSVIICQMFYYFSTSSGQLLNLKFFIFFQKINFLKFLIVLHRTFNRQKTLSSETGLPDSLNKRDKHRGIGKEWRNVEYRQT